MEKMNSGPDVGCFCNSMFILNRYDFEKTSENCFEGKYIYTFDYKVPIAHTLVFSQPTEVLGKFNSPRMTGNINSNGMIQVAIGTEDNVSPVFDAYLSTFNHSRSFNLNKTMYFNATPAKANALPGETITVIIISENEIDWNSDENWFSMFLLTKDIIENGPFISSE